MKTGRNTIEHERALLRLQYGALFHSVAAILFEADPMGINFEINTSEYEPEVGTILPGLGGARTVQDVERIIHEEFVRWFGAELAGPQENYQVVAMKVWEAQSAFRRTRPGHDCCDSSQD